MSEEIEPSGAIPESLGNGDGDMPTPVKPRHSFSKGNAGYELRREAEARTGGSRVTQMQKDMRWVYTRPPERDRTPAHRACRAWLTSDPKGYVSRLLELERELQPTAPSPALPSAPPELLAPEFEPVVVPAAPPAVVPPPADPSVAVGSNAERVCGRCVRCDRVGVPRPADCAVCRKLRDEPTAVAGEAGGG